jgi:hypothetical protein
MRWARRAPNHASTACAGAMHAGACVGWSIGRSSK